MKEKFYDVLDNIGIRDQSEEETPIDTIPELIRKIDKCEARTLGEMVELIHKVNGREMENKGIRH